MNKPTLLLAHLGLVLTLSGCGPTSGLSPSVSQGGFDNAKTVAIEPHSTLVSGGSVTSLGAQWTEAHPKSAILIVEVLFDYTAITGLDLNIDGRKISLAPTATVTGFGDVSSPVKTSSKGFVTDLRTIQQILSSSRTWVRIHTPTGTVENAVVDGSSRSKAYYALQRFMEKVGER